MWFVALLCVVCTAATAAARVHHHQQQRQVGVPFVNVSGVPLSARAALPPVHQQQLRVQREQQRTLQHQLPCLPRVSVSVLRSLTGMAAASCSVSAARLPHFAHEHSVALFALLLAPRDTMPLLLDGSWGVLLMPAQLRVVWDDASTAQHWHLDLPLPANHSCYHNWCHLAFVRTTRRLHIYANGVLLNFIIDFDPVASFSRLYVGAPPNYQGRASPHSLYQHVVYYNYAINATELDAHRLTANFSAHVPVFPDLDLVHAPDPYIPPRSFPLSRADVDVLEQFVEADNSTSALATLGELYLTGTTPSIKQNVGMARMLFQRCAVRNSMCIFYLGFIAAYYDHNETLSTAYYAVAAAVDDNLWATIALGTRYVYGLMGARRDKFAGLCLMEKAADFAFRSWQREGLKLTEYNSLANYEKAIIDGQNAKVEQDEMIEVEKYKAEAMDKRAAEWLGDQYFHGKRSMQVDIELAAKYYEMANTTTAKVQLARMHYQKLRRLENATFKAYIEEGVKKRSADAANLLGCTTPDEREALQIFEEATRMEPPWLPVVTTNAGVMHSLSASFQQDQESAQRFFVISAAQGDRPGLYWLGKLWSREIGDMRTAARFLQAAVRYHVHLHWGRKAWQLVLMGKMESAKQLYLMCGELGFGEGHVDALNYLVSTFEPSEHRKLKLQLADSIMRGLHFMSDADAAATAVSSLGDDAPQSAVQGAAYQLRHAHALFIASDRLAAAGNVSSAVAHLRHLMWEGPNWAVQLAAIVRRVQHLITHRI